MPRLRIRRRRLSTVCALALSTASSKPSLWMSVAANLARLRGDKVVPALRS